MNKIETRKCELVNGKTLIIAVDIGKTTNVGYGRCPNGIETLPFEFSNNGEGFKKLWDRVCQLLATHHLEQVVVGFEPTGSYAEPLVHYLMKRSVKIVQVNPMHTKRLKDLQGNSPGKTDQKDPKVIADIISLGHALNVIVPEGPAAELRRLTQARERSIQRRTALYNQLQDLMFILFPEFLQVMKDVKTRSAHYLLRHYPRPEDLIRCGLEALGVALKRISRGKLGSHRASALYQAAQQSIGVREGEKGMLLEVQELLSQIKASNCFIKRVEQEMDPLLHQIPYIDSILSVKGIGKITAAGLIGEVGDFRKFRMISEILKLAGLDLFEISSGQHRGNRHISKRGRSLLRRLLFFAALSTIRKGGVMQIPYQRYIQRGMPRGKAVVAIARKLLRILFALIRDHSQFKENYSNLENLKLAA